MSATSRVRRFVGAIIISAGALAALAGPIGARPAAGSEFERITPISGPRSSATTRARITPSGRSWRR